MALLKPTVATELLQELELGSSTKETRDPTKPKSASDILEDKGFGKERAIQQLIDKALYADDEALQFKATETALRMHRLIDDKNSQNAVPSFQIIIKGDANVLGILSPREI